MSTIERRRTAALGGLVEQWDVCEHRRLGDRSCRDRHCPECQGCARADWLENRCGELDCECHHVVFTLPVRIAAIAL